VLGEVGVGALRAVECECCGAGRSQSEAFVEWASGEGKGTEKERHKYTFRILLCLLRGSIGVGIVNASWFAVLARVLGVGEVKDEGGGCGEDYVAGDLLVFCYVEEVIAGMGSSWRRAA
jgi:hypothetical protein